MRSGRCRHLSSLFEGGLSSAAKRIQLRTYGQLSCNALVCEIGEGQQGAQRQCGNTTKVEPAVGRCMKALSTLLIAEATEPRPARPKQQRAQLGEYQEQTEQVLLALLTTIQHAREIGHCAGFNSGNRNWTIRRKQRFCRSPQQCALAHSQCSNRRSTPMATIPAKHHEPCRDSKACENQNTVDNPVSRHMVRLGQHCADHMISVTRAAAQRSCQ